MSRQRIMDALAWWVRFASTHAMIVVVLSGLLSVAGGWYAAKELSINTSTTEMLSEDLPFRRNDRALDAAFPESDHMLTVVVEASTPEAVDRLAHALEERLEERADLFLSVLYLEGHPFFQRNGLLYLSVEELQDLGTELAEAQPILAELAVDPTLRGLAAVVEKSIAAIESGDMSDTSLERLRDFLGRLAPVVRAADDGEAAPLSWQELFHGSGREEETSRRFILVQPDYDYGSLKPAARAIDVIKEISAEVSSGYGEGTRVRITGAPYMFQQELESVRSGIGLVGLLTAGLVTFILAFGLRSVALVLSTLLSLVVGLTWTAAFAAAAVGELNLISVAFGVLFIGVSADLGIHLVLRFKEELYLGVDKPTAMQRVSESIGGALVLCALSTAAGFFAFLPTAYRGLSELGLISGAGMFIALAVTLTVLPAILTVFPMRRLPGPPLGVGWAGRVYGWLQALADKRARLITFAALGVAVLAALTVPYLRFDDDPLNLRDRETESVATFLDLVEDERVSPYSAKALVPDLEAARQLAGELSALPVVERAKTLASFVPAEQEEKLAIIDEIAVFLAPVFLSEAKPPPGPEERREALERLIAALEGREQTLGPPGSELAEALKGFTDASAEKLARLEEVLLGELPALIGDLRMSLQAEAVTLDTLPPTLVERWMSDDGRALVEIEPREDLTDRGARLRFVEAVQGIAPGVTGAPVVIAEAGTAVIEAFVMAGLIALAVIVILLIGILRSLKDTLLVLVPLALAALLTGAATVVLDLPFNFANVIVLPLLLGLGIDSAIHIVVRARRRGGPSGLMGTSTPRAVLLSALTTIASFASLSISSHVGMASMGLLLTIAVSLTVVTTLLVLPALLSLFHGGGMESH